MYMLSLTCNKRREQDISVTDNVKVNMPLTKHHTGAMHQIQMVSGQLHASSALPQRNEPPVSTGEEGG
jgi:DNA gyrase/topoisomerase IV subunit B